MARALTLDFAERGSGAASQAAGAAAQMGLGIKAAVVAATQDASPYGSIMRRAILQARFYFCLRFSAVLLVPLVIHAVDRMVQSDEALLLRATQAAAVEGALSVRRDGAVVSPTGEVLRTSPMLSRGLDESGSPVRTPSLFLFFLLCFSSYDLPCSGA